MKWASPALTAYLAAAVNGGPVFLMADLVTITLANGSIYNWTDADTNLIMGGVTFTAAVDQGGQPIMNRGEIKNTRGLDVSTTDITLFCGQSAKILGINAQLAAHNGAFDLASVLIQRVFMPTWGDCTTLGAVVMFDGLVAAVDLGSTEVVLHVDSMLTLLTVQMPRTLFLPGCANTFGDASCGIVLSSLTLGGTITSGSTTLAIKGAPTKAAQYYQNGVVTFTSGLNAGAQVAVSNYDGTTITPATPLPSPPSVGDTFTVYPGCARTIGACAAFSNSGNFRGAPFIPPAESGL